MSSNLIAWVIAISLGTAVVVLGLRRNLADITRSWLPRYGKAPEPAPAMGSSTGQGRRQLSPRQRLILGGLYLLIGLGRGVEAFVSADDRLLNAIGAAVFSIGAVVLILQSRRLP